MQIMYLPFLQCLSIFDHYNYDSFVLPDCTWKDVSTEPLTEIVLCKIVKVPLSNRQPVLITHCLTIHANLKWTIYVNNRLLSQHICTALSSVPHTLSVDSAKTFLGLINSLNVCSGQVESHFIMMFRPQKRKGLSVDGTVQHI
jgi:hypothetical protein